MLQIIAVAKVSQKISQAKQTLYLERAVVVVTEHLLTVGFRSGNSVGVDVHC